MGDWCTDEVSDIGELCYGWREEGRCFTALWSWLGLEFDRHDPELRRSSSMLREDIIQFGDLWRSNVGKTRHSPEVRAKFSRRRFQLVRTV